MYMCNLNRVQTLCLFFACFARQQSSHKVRSCAHVPHKHLSWLEFESRFFYPARVEARRQFESSIWSSEYGRTCNRKYYLLYNIPWMCQGVSQVKVHTIYRLHQIHSIQQTIDSPFRTTWWQIDSHWPYYACIHSRLINNSNKTNTASKICG